jgi:[ribosomal protein S5]-alanine N-acetyltransferase
MEIMGGNDRIYLREVVLEDWEAFHPYSSNEETVKHQPWGPNTEEDSFFFVRQILMDKKQRHRSRFVFAIIEKETEVVVGNIEMNIRDWDGVGEIGFIIHHDYWGRELATEAVHIMIEYSFQHCELQRIFATSCPENIASIKVLEKVGMVKEGTLRKDLLVKGEWKDSCIYSMLREEWIEKSARP